MPCCCCSSLAVIGVDFVRLELCAVRRRRAVVASKIQTSIPLRSRRTTRNHTRIATATSLSERREYKCIGSERDESVTSTGEQWYACVHADFRAPPLESARTITRSAGWSVSHSHAPTRTHSPMHLSGCVLCSTNLPPPRRDSSVRVVHSSFAMSLPSPALMYWPGQGGLTPHHLHSYMAGITAAAAVQPTPAFPIPPPMMAHQASVASLASTPTNYAHAQATHAAAAAATASSSSAAAAAAEKKSSEERRPWTKVSSARDTSTACGRHTRPTCTHTTTPIATITLLEKPHVYELPRT
jgi:hypothetical protein